MVITNLFRDFKRSFQKFLLRNPFFYLFILLQIHKRRLSDIYTVGFSIQKALEARFPFQALQYRAQLNEISFPFCTPVSRPSAFFPNWFPQFSPLMPGRWREMDRVLVTSDPDKRFPEMCTDERQLLYILLSVERELILLDFYIPLTTAALALSTFLLIA